MSGSYIAGAIILSVFILVAVFVRLAVRGSRRFEMLKKQTLDRAVAADAEILSVAHAGGGSVVGGVRRIGLRLTLNVRHPARGSYQTSAVWLVNELLIPQVQPASVLPVLVNGDDPHRVYPNADGMEFADWIFKRI